MELKLLPAACLASKVNTTSSSITRMTGYGMLISQTGHLTITTCSWWLVPINCVIS